jgi:hypothetical protein
MGRTPGFLRGLCGVSPQSCNEHRNAFVAHDDEDAMDGEVNRE